MEGEGALRGVCVEGSDSSDEALCATRAVDAECVCAESVAGCVSCNTLQGCVWCGQGSHRLIGACLANGTDCANLNKRYLNVPHCPVPGLPIVVTFIVAIGGGLVLFVGVLGIHLLQKRARDRKRLQEEQQQDEAGETSELLPD